MKNKREDKKERMKERKKEEKIYETKGKEGRVKVDKNIEIQKER